jgi:hypothetical protein
MPALKLRTYQLPVFLFRGKFLLVEFARQTGKSFTMANWAVARLLERLSRPEVRNWLIVVISNSKGNGIEFGQKISDVLEAVREADAQIRGQLESFTREEPERVTDEDRAILSGAPIEIEDFAQRMEIRLSGKKGRIMVLAASPRTARGFSGDLALDEFAHHENANKIWDAAEPIVSANPEYQVRIASTHNGIGTLFHRWVQDGRFPVASIKRSEAWNMGQGSERHLREFADRWERLDPKAFAAWKASPRYMQAQPQDRIVIGSLIKQPTDGGAVCEITPDEAEAEAGWAKAEYRQNYENEPYHGDNLPFLSWDLISRSMTAPAFAPDQQAWADSTLAALARHHGNASLYVGQDFARNGDLSVVSVLAENQGSCVHVARLEMRDQTTPHQRRQMERLMGAVGGRVQRVVMDMTGNGTGLSDELAERYGSLILPVHFASTVPLDDVLRTSGDKRATMLISERMAVDLQRSMEDGKIALPHDDALREDMRKPCRVIRGSRVLVASAKDSNDHADRFWSLALALHGYFSDGLGGWDMTDLNAVEVGEPEFDGFFARW